jgi:hypothetical protein
MALELYKSPASVAFEIILHYNDQQEIETSKFIKMLLYPNLFILFLAGASQAAPAPSSTGSAPSIPSSPYTSPTKISSSVVLAQRTAAAKNSTVSASFSGSNYTDEAPSINPNATLHSLTKPGMKVPRQT